MRSSFTEIGKESLFKRLQTAGQDESSLEQGTFLPSSRDTLKEVLTLFANTPFSCLFEKALDGDVAALNTVQSLGLWEVFLYDQWAVSGVKLSPQAAFVLDIERASKEPERLARLRDFEAAAEALATHPVMRQFMWPEALRIFSSTTEPAHLLPVRASVALEIRLSLIALIDVTVTRDAGTPTVSYFSCLIPSDELSDMNPTSLFFRWFRDKAGAATIEALLAKNKSGKGGIANTTTLKRWSNGSHQPSVVWFKALAQEQFGNGDDEALWNRYWASRYLNFVGHTAELMRQLACQREPGQHNSLAPWPQLPFGCDSIPGWLATRYPHWLAYHRHRLLHTQ